jgi:hypothetical protein
VHSVDRSEGLSTYIEMFSVKKTDLSSIKNTSQNAQTSPELIFHIIDMSEDSSVSLSVLIPVLKSPLHLRIQQSLNRHLL